MKMFLETMEWLKTQSHGGKFANPRQMAISLGLDDSGTTKLYKALRGAVPRSDTLFSWLEGLGAKILLPGSEGKLPLASPLADPLAQRVETVAKPQREAGVAELEILRSVRSMLDSEIAKAQSSYGTREPGASFDKAAEEPAPYPAEKKDR